MRLGILGSWVLAGSRCTVYFNNTVTGEESLGAQVSSYNLSDSAHDTNAQALYQSLIDSHYFLVSAAHPNFNGFVGMSLCVERAFNAGNGYEYQIPIANTRYEEFFSW